MIINLQLLADSGDVNAPCTVLSVNEQFTTNMPVPEIGSMWPDVDDHMMDTYARIQEQLELSALDYR
jgi:hypothetical protein